MQVGCPLCAKKTWVAGSRTLHRPAEADAPIIAAYWMIAPRYGSITAPLSEQTT